MYEQDFRRVHFSAFTIFGLIVRTSGSDSTRVYGYWYQNNPVSIVIFPARALYKGWFRGISCSIVGAGLTFLLSGAFCVPPTPRHLCHGLDKHSRRTLGHRKKVPSLADVEWLIFLCKSWTLPLLVGSVRFLVCW